MTTVFTKNDRPASHLSPASPQNQGIPERHKTLAARTAERLRHYVRHNLDETSEQSWHVAYQLWRAAYWTRFARLEGFEVHHEPPPIPVRRFDWHATERDYDLGRPMGFGATAADAIEDLQEQLS